MRQAQKATLVQLLLETKRDIIRIKDKANYAIRDRNSRLADILASLKSFNTEHSQATTECGGAANKPACSGTNNDTRPQRTGDKHISATTSQGDESVNADSRQWPIESLSESATPSSTMVSARLACISAENNYAPQVEASAQSTLDQGDIRILHKLPIGRAEKNPVNNDFIGCLFL